MKYIIRFVISLILINPIGLQASDFVFSKFDKSLITLWKSTNENDISKCKLDFKKVNQEWFLVKTEIKTQDFQKLNKTNFISKIEKYLIEIQKDIEQKKVTDIEKGIVSILNNFKDLRQILNQKKYPLDLLVDLKNKYQEIHLSVHDPMMNLLDWFEFQDLVNDLVDSWSAYECLEENQLKKFNAELNTLNHKEISIEFNNCLERFLLSLDSGFRTDFEMPCDDMDNALSKLIWLHR